MSRPFSETLHCRVQVSTYMLTLNRGVHAVVLAVVLALSLYRPILLLLAPVIAMSHHREQRRIRLSGAGSIHQLRWAAGDQWTWRRNDGREVRGRLLDATVLGHYAVILRLRSEQRRFGTTTVLLAADGLAPAVHRRLRARLTLWQPERAEADAYELMPEWLSRLRTVARARR